MFEMGIRGANAKVDQAVEDILNLEEYVRLVSLEVEIYYFE